ncbi:Crp/Fnr family transcriptional regulator [Halomonas sediminis]
MRKSSENNDRMSIMTDGWQTFRDGFFYHCLGRYAELPIDCRYLFLKEESERIDVEKHQVLKAGGGAESDVYVLESGWACSFVPSGNGDREIIDIFLPGDIIGLREGFLTGENADVVMLTSGSLVGMKYSALHGLAKENENIGSAILRLIIIHDNILIERLRSCTQYQAEKRVAHFLLELHARLSFSKIITGSYFNIPITQAITGNLLGITSVHVSRCMSALENRKLIRKQRNGVELLKAKVMSHETGFNEDDLYKNFMFKGG